MRNLLDLPEEQPPRLDLAIKGLILGVVLLAAGVMALKWLL